ncbi:YdhK family protein [Brevibacillus choshinensis]|uniref:YdhK family protein n=1 Tax=Brevibacillus choshinensis TaxID=54911 RepID=UPI002E216BEB|nr:YdhK family protein [Brevibacillus choshinensis]
MKKQLAILSVASIMILSGCGNNAAPAPNNQPNQSQETIDQGMNHGNMDHANMDHSSSGEIPNGLKEASNPTYKVGSQAIIKSDHMEGMNGATATIVGAYDTTAYAISYTPTTGGPRVTNHKWIIHQEIKDAGTEPFKPGTEVIVQAEHMKGMNGVTATIDSAQPTTVYMVDYTPTTGGEIVRNHKWVTESELSAK